MVTLTGKDRRALRAMGNPLRAVVYVGKEGVTDALLQSIGEAHARHELIKVKIVELAGHDRKDVAAQLEQRTDSQVVGMVGGTILLYRRDPESPKIVLPSESGGESEEPA